MGELVNNSLGSATNSRRSAVERLLANAGQRSLLLGLILLGFSLRIYNLGETSLWFDELLQMDIASGKWEQIWPQLHRHAAMPLDYYLLHGWLKLGHQEAWVRFPAMAFGVLTIPMLYALSKQLFNNSVAIIATTLITVSSFSIEYSQEGRPYALLMFLTIVIYWGVWQAYQTKQFSYWGVAIIALFAAVLSHYFALFIIIPVGLFVGIKQLSHYKNKYYWLYSSVFLGAVVILILGFILAKHTVVFGVAKGFLSDIRHPQTLTRPAAEKPNRGTGPAFDMPTLINNIFKPLGSKNNSGLVYYNALFIIVILQLFNIGLFYKKGQKKQQTQHQKTAILLLLMWLIVPILLIYVFLLQRGTFFAIRYILYTLPAYLILISVAIQGVINIVLKAIFYGEGNNTTKLELVQTKILLRNGLALLVILPLLFVEFDELLTYYKTPAYENWRAVGQLLQNNAKQNDAVIALKTEATINWYYPPAKTPPNTFSTNEAIWQTLNAHPRRWFILSSYSRKVDEKLRAWLVEEGAVAIPIDRRILVYFHHQGLSSAAMQAEVESFKLD